MENYICAGGCYLCNAAILLHIIMLTISHHYLLPKLW